MHKNRFIQLTKMSTRSERVGSKLSIPINFAQSSTDFTDTQQLINTFTHNNQRIKELRNELQKTVTPDGQKSITNQVNRLVKQNRNLMVKIEKQVKEINSENAEEVAKNNKANTFKVRQITQKASASILEFKESQEKFSNGVKDTIRRQAIIIQGDISEQEVEEIMTNPEKGQDMLRAKLLNSPSVQLQNAVDDIIDKYNDIIRLQKSMHECLEMTRELALLVALTSQQLDSIEMTIVEANDYTEKGVDSMQKAKQYHKQAKKKMCCIIMLLLAAIGAVLIPILITKLG